MAEVNLPDSRPPSPTYRQKHKRLRHIGIIRYLSKHTLHNPNIPVQSTRYRSADDERRECFGEAERDHGEGKAGDACEEDWLTTYCVGEAAPL